MRGAKGPTDAPPGPSGFRWSGNLAEYEADRLGFLRRTRDEYGGLVTFDVGTTLVHDAALAERVLRDRTGGFDIRMDLLNRRISAQEAATKLDDRHNLGPSPRPVDPAALIRRVDEIVAETFQRATSQSTVLDPIPMLEPAIGRIIAEFYFGSDWHPVPDAVSRLLESLGAVFGNVLSLPASWPTPARVRVRRSYERLRDLTEQALERRLAAPQERRGDDRQDHLFRIANSSALYGPGSLRRVSHAVVGSLIAAYRVPAAAAAWTLLELARRPDLQRELRDALVQPTSIEPAAPALLWRVITEATRLHPPTWLLRRTASRPIELGGYQFREGSHFLISPYVIHRDPVHFDRAEDFVPERWMQPAPGRPHLTFGFGPHRCPGSGLAQHLLVALLRSVVGRWAIREAATSRVTADARTTLVPRDMRLAFAADPLDLPDLTPSRG